MRIVVADDSVLFREGLVRLLVEAGHDVVGKVGDADALVASVARHRPDLALIDIRMPPTMTDDGARTARDLRYRYPELPMILLSQHVETRHSVALVASGASATCLRIACCGWTTFSTRSAGSRTADQPWILRWWARCLGPATAITRWPR